RVERRQLLAVLEHDLADGGLPLIRQNLAQQVERLAANRVRLEVIGLLDELDPLALTMRVDEHLDLDRPDRLERDCLEVLVVEDDVASLRPLVATYRLRPRDDLVIHRAVDLHLDSAQVLLMEQVEADGAALG